MRVVVTSVFVNDPVERENVMLGSRVQGHKLFLWGAWTFFQGKGGKAECVVLLAYGCSLPTASVYSVTWKHPQLRMSMLHKKQWLNVSETRVFLLAGC